MSVKGQDEAAMHLARLKWSADQPSDVRVSVRDFEAGYRAALVGSEARERELERERDYAKEGQLSWKETAERAERLRSDAELRCEGLQARQAVLVEALKKYGQHLDECNTIQGWGTDNPCDCGFASALAGVVEAEPAGRCFCGHPEREGYGHRSHECGRIGRAEPDGRTDG